jgi:NAD(P)-dependent dehydrogenase (short-subunit alcohol dehydrogenase family)
MRFKEKIAIVTGGASGQGLETCKRLASEGALVIVADWNGEGAKRTADEIGGKAFQVNVAHESEVAAMIDFAISSHRRLDILINNAGIGYSATGQYTMASVVRTPEADWDAILAINLKGVAMGCKHAIPIMVNQGGGVIVNIASINGIAGWTGADAYIAAKGGVVALTRVLAVDWAAKGVRVNRVCPRRGRHADDPRSSERAEPSEHGQHPDSLGRIGEPNEIAAVSLFLASDDASFLHGAIIPVDGGQVAQ